MGLFDFINRKREERKWKKVAKVDKSIADNLILLSQGRIRVVECIATLAYFTERQIYLITDFDQHREKTAKQLATFFIIYFQLSLKERNISPIRDIKYLARETAKYISENNKSINEDNSENYIKWFRWQFKRINDQNFSDKNTLVKEITTLIFEQHERFYAFDISDRKKDVKNILSTNAENLNVTIEESDTSKLKSDLNEYYDPYLSLEEW